MASSFTSPSAGASNFEVESPRVRTNTSQSRARSRSSKSISRASVGTPLLTSDLLGVNPDGITQREATLSLMTCIIGAGIMALPQLPTKGGWVVSTVFMCLCCVAIALAGVDGIWKGFVSYNTGKAKEDQLNSYEDLGRQAFGRRGEVLVCTTMAIWFIGALAGYTILVAQQLEAMSRMFNFPISQQIWTYIVFLPFLALSFLRDISAIAKIVPIGIVGAFLSCTIIFMKALFDANTWQGWTEADLDGIALHQMWPQSSMSLGSVLATLFGAFGVNANVPAVMSEMRNKAEFPCALRTALAIVLCLYLSIMLFGHYGYGNYVQSNILISMSRAPSSAAEAFAEFKGGNLKWCEWTGPCGWMASFAMQVSVLANLVISFPLNLMSVIQSFQTMDGIADKIPVGTIQNYLMRASLVVLIFAIALTVPSFDVVFAFFASVCGPSLQVIFPIYFGYKVEVLASGSHMRLSPTKIVILIVASACVIFGFIDSFGALAASLRPTEACDRDKEIGYCGDDSMWHLN